MRFSCYSVEIPGFEPGLGEPKSLVLPLHHISIEGQRYKLFPYLCLTMKRHALFLALAALLALPPAGAFAQENDTLAFERGFWLDMNQGEGLKLRLASYNDGRPLFGSSQSLSVLIVSPERECALVAAPEGKLALTSEMAADAGAAAAVNGSFFHMKAPYGGSTYARIDGVKVSENAPVENFWRDPQRSGAIVVSDGKFRIVTGFGPERTYEESLPGETVLTTGPMLLQAGDTSNPV